MNTEMIFLEHTLRALARIEQACSPAGAATGGRNALLPSPLEASPSTVVGTADNGEPFEERA
jgi:hypothetical protein